MNSSNRLPFHPGSLSPGSYDTHSLSSDIYWCLFGPHHYSILPARNTPRKQCAVFSSRCTHSQPRHISAI